MLSVLSSLVFGIGFIIVAVAIWMVKKWLIILEKRIDKLEDKQI